MTDAAILKHWKEGAKDAFEAARILHDHGKYSLALFNTHLAVEKALKSLYMEQHDMEPPHTHELQIIAAKIRHGLTGEQEEWLDAMTNFSVGARYEDVEWFEEWATESHSAQWLDRTAVLLSLLLP